MLPKRKNKKPPWIPFYRNPGRLVEPAHIHLVGVNVFLLIRRDADRSTVVNRVSGELTVRVIAVNVPIP